MITCTWMTDTEAEIEKGEDGDFCPLKQETGQVSLHPSSSAKHSKKTDIVVVIYM